MADQKQEAPKLVRLKTPTGTVVAVGEDLAKTLLNGRGYEAAEGATNATPGAVQSETPKIPARVMKTTDAGK